MAQPHHPRWQVARWMAYSCWSDPEPFDVQKMKWYGLGLGGARKIRRWAACHSPSQRFTNFQCSQLEPWKLIIQVMHNKNSLLIVVIIGFCLCIVDSCLGKLPFLSSHLGVGALWCAGFNRHEGHHWLTNHYALFGIILKMCAYLVLDTHRHAWDKHQWSMA